MSAKFITLAVLVVLFIILVAIDGRRKIIKKHEQEK